MWYLLLLVVVVGLVLWYVSPLLLLAVAVTYGGIVAGTALVMRVLEARAARRAARGDV